MRYGEMAAVWLTAGLLAATPVAAEDGPGAAPGVHIGETAFAGRTCLTIGNARAELYLDAQAFTLVQLVDLTTQADYVREAGGPLFSVSLKNTPANWFETAPGYSTDGTNAGRRWWAQANDGDATVLVLHYDRCLVGEFGQAVDVTVTIRATPDDPVFLWGLTVAGTAADWLDEVHFPTLRGLGSSLDGSAAADYVVAPTQSGAILDRPRSRGHLCGQGDCEYPSGGCTVQLLTYCDGLQRGSLYLAAQDAAGYRKTLVARSMSSRASFVWYWQHYADGRVANGVWTLPYKVACGPLAGDSYDAAKRYRRWALEQGLIVPLANRKDIPSWYRDLTIWYQGNDWGPSENNLTEFTHRLQSIRARLGEEYGFHWYIWAKNLCFNSANGGDPDYFPARPGFKEAVAAVQQAGVRVMPYINVELYDIQLPMWTRDHAEQWASRDIRGQMYRTVWSEPKIKMVNMCAATTYYQDLVVNCIKTLVQEYKVDGVYLDELHVYPYLCYAKNHLHAAHGGNYGWTGYRTMIERAKAECGRPQLMLTGEACSEAYAALVSGQLNGGCDMTYAPPPVLQSVLKDCTIDFGMIMHREAESAKLPNFAAKQGFIFVRGRQLGWIMTDQTDLLEPRYDDQIAFLKALSAARHAALDFLLYGEFLREPDLSKVGRHSVEWATAFGQSPIPTIAVADVMAAAYRAPGGDLGLVLVNVTGTPQTVQVPVNERDWPVHVGQRLRVSTYQAGRWRDAVDETLGRTIDLTLDAWSPAMLRLAPIR
jgi:hypothetical protein